MEIEDEHHLEKFKARAPNGSLFVGLAHKSTLCFSGIVNKFGDSEPVIARFPSNKGRNSDIRIPHNSLELHPAPCMRDVCYVRWLGPSCKSKQNVLSLILLLPLAKLTNQKRGICRHRILYPLRLRLPFPNVARIPRPKVSLGPNQMLN